MRSFKTSNQLLQVGLVLLALSPAIARGASFKSEDELLRAGRASDEKPDIFLGWMNNPALEQFKPFFAQIQQTMGPMSQQVSGQILETIPGAKEVFKQVSQMQEQFGSMVSQFNPAQQIMGSLTGGGSSSSSSNSGGQSGGSGSSSSNGGGSEEKSKIRS